MNRVVAYLRRNRVAAGAAAVGTAAVTALVLRARAGRDASSATSSRVPSVPVYSSAATDVYDTVEPLVEQLTELANRISQPPAQPAAARDPDVQPTRQTILVNFPANRYRPSPSSSPAPSSPAPSWGRFVPRPGTTPAVGGPGVIGLLTRRQR